MSYISERLKDKKGAVAVYFAIMFIVFIGFTALAVDVGYFMVSRNQLQNAADASALAATRALGNIYAPLPPAAPMSYEDQQVYVCDPNDIIPVAKAVAANNSAAGKPVLVQDADVKIGKWDAVLRTFTQTLNQPNAVQVTTRRDTTAGVGGQISTFFAKIFGINNVSLTAEATASLTGESSAGEGGLPIPVAINKSWMSTLPCNSDLTLHPSSTGICAAWHAYDGGEYKPNDSVGSGMRGEIAALTNGTYSSPETTAGVTQYDFTNGTLAAVFTGSYIQDLFNTMKVKNDGILDHDEDPATWTTTVPIFDDTVEGCHPNGLVTIVGFTTITISQVSPPPVTTIYAKIKCGNIVSGRGSGGNYGTMGNIPNLVK